MIVVDVNLLPYAVISGFPQHAKAHAWWEQTLNGTTEVGLASPAIFGFLRISANPRVLTAPLAVDQAVGHMRDWLALPNVMFLQPGPRHLDVAFDLFAQLGNAANLTTDVRLAALAIEHGAELCSNDTDFGRFPSPQWVNPLR